MVFRELRDEDAESVAALSFEAFSEARAMDAEEIPRAGLGVDVENPTGALRLYERAGMSKVAQWDHYMLEL